MTPTTKSSPTMVRRSGVRRDWLVGDEEADRGDARTHRGGDREAGGHRREGQREDDERRGRSAMPGSRGRRRPPRRSRRGPRAGRARGGRRARSTASAPIGLQPTPPMNVSAVKSHDRRAPIEAPSRSGRAAWPGGPARAIVAERDAPPSAARRGPGRGATAARATREPDPERRPATEPALHRDGCSESGARSRAGRTRTWGEGSGPDGSGAVTRQDYPCPPFGMARTPSASAILRRQYPICILAMHPAHA